jgi:hypothetical protein
MSQDYDHKTAAYFGNARVEIEPLLSASAARVLEVGCGAGETVRWLKETGLDEGILDRTHLRFFTRKSAQQLAAGSAFQVERCISHRPPRNKLEKLNRWTFGLLDDLTAVQYLIAASSTSPIH